MHRFHNRILTGFWLMLVAAMINVEAAGLKQGDIAPDFSLKNLDGQQVALQDLLAKGHVMLIFWETQCVYCYSHIKEFNTIHKQYQNKGLTVAAINFLGEYESEIREYVIDNNVQYLILADRLNNIDVAEAYQVIGSPTIVMIAPNRKILSYGHKIPDISNWLP